MEPMFAFDTETTGLDRGSRAIEIAGVMFDETGVLSSFETLINPGMPIPPDVTKINGITDDMVKDAPDTREALLRFFSWVGDCRVAIAHYAQYDTGIVSWDAGRVGVVIPTDMLVVDTCELAKAIGATKNNKLDTVAAHYGIQRIGNAHRAASDVDMCYQIFQKMTDAKGHMPPAHFYRQWALAGHDYEFTASLPSLLVNLPQWIERGEPMPFVYEDEKGVQSTRTITPYGWCANNEYIYFHGHCHKRSAETGKHERRTFRADRVKEVLGLSAA